MDRPLEDVIADRQVCRAMRPDFHLLAMVPILADNDLLLEAKS